LTDGIQEPQRALFTLTLNVLRQKGAQLIERSHCCVFGREQNTHRPPKTSSVATDDLKASTEGLNARKGLCSGKREAPQ